MKDVSDLLHPHAMSSQSKILQTLITRGICECSDAALLDDINALLHQMGYEAVLWPSKSHFILRDTSGSPEVLPPWAEASIEEVKRIFEYIALRRPVHSVLLEQLKEYSWIECDADGGLALSKRALIQFSDYLVSLGGRYGRCKVCSIIVDSGDYHDYCFSLLQR